MKQEYKGELVKLNDEYWWWNGRDMTKKLPNESGVYKMTCREDAEDAVEAQLFDMGFTHIWIPSALDRGEC